MVWSFRNSKCSILRKKQSILNGIATLSLIILRSLPTKNKTDEARTNRCCFLFFTKHEAKCSYMFSSSLSHSQENQISIFRRKLRWRTVAVFPLPDSLALLDYKGDEAELPPSPAHLQRKLSPSLPIPAEFPSTAPNPPPKQGRPAMTKRIAIPNHKTGPRNTTSLYHSPRSLRRIVMLLPASSIGIGLPTSPRLRSRRGRRKRDRSQVLLRRGHSLPVGLPSSQISEHGRRKVAA